MSRQVRVRSTSSRTRNLLKPKDRAINDWYRFVLSFPPHLVRDYIGAFEVGRKQQVLDPFCGTGTTLVECKKLGIPSVGIERNPMAWFASSTKVDWSVEPDRLVDHAENVARCARNRLRRNGSALRSLPPDQSKLLITNSISPRPLHKTLALLDALEQHRDENSYQHERLALATELVSGISNLHFGPEVGVRRIQKDAPVVEPWLNRIKAMSRDIEAFRKRARTKATVHLADARQLEELIEPESIDAVITSPPYPNEKDYTRTTRLESVLLGFIRNKHDLREMKKSLVRSNTRSVYKEDTDDSLIENHKGIQRIANLIESRRIEQNKTSGFERQYARVTRLYFGGMVRHLASLRRALRPGARLAYVVGDQASYLRVMIRTGRILGELAESLGYELTSIDLFRERIATASGQYLREEVVRLRWPG